MGGDQVNGNGAANGASGSEHTRMEPRRPLAVDLFAGAGGMSLGLEQAGFDVVAAVEYDPIHAATHEFNFPLTAMLCRDVSTLTAAELREAAAFGRHKHGHHGAWDGQLDLIVGGPPCQGFSLIGKRLVDDPRNQLVFHFFRLVRDLRPRYFAMENVPGMMVGGHSSILNRLVSEFGSEGYSVVEPISVLNAADYGVPQLRRRVFVIGAREDERLPEYPIPTTLRADAEPGDAPEKGGLLVGPTVWDAIGDLPNLDDFDELEATDEALLDQRALRAAERASSPYARRARGLDRDADDLSHPRRWKPQILTSSARTRHTALSVKRFTATTPGDVEPVSRFLRLATAGLCNTLRAGTGSERGAYTSPRPIHPVHPRVISVREAARLHSFPDWFRFHRTKWHGFRQVGNAVAPLVGRAVGQQVAAALGVAPPIPTRPVILGSPDLLELTMAEAASHFGAEADAIPQQRRRSVGASAAPA